MSLRPVTRALLKAGGTTALTTVVAAPLVRRGMLRHGVLDVPNHRSSHATPTPRGGGIACLVGVATGLATLEGTENAARRRIPLALIMTPLAMSALGYADDHLSGLPVLPRLGAQLGAGAVAATADLPPAAAVASLVAMPGFVNVVNFMDGINGITGSTMVTWGVSAAEAAVRRSDLSLAALGAVTAGAGLGFLPWNVPQAKLFLGDTGSYLFGGLVASGAAAAARSPYGHGRSSDWSTAFQVVAPLLPYVADAAQAIVRRAMAGENLAEAHREHVYQRLVDHVGLSHVQVSLLHASIAAGVAGAARLRLPAALPLAAALVAAYIASPAIAEAFSDEGPEAQELP